MIDINHLIRQFLSQAAFFDLETTTSGKILHIGAIKDDHVFEIKETTNPVSSLAELDAFCSDKPFLMGHNILHHDLLIVRKLHPELSILKRSVVDTLYLSPLAFPENPYHRLIKDYKLVKSDLNNPVADARLAKKIFMDQCHSFYESAKTNKDLLAFYQFCFRDFEIDGQLALGEGLATLFAQMDVPKINAQVEALKTWHKLTRDLVCPYHSNKKIPSILGDGFQKSMLAFCVAWLQVAGGNSIISPWVRHRYHNMISILKNLRSIDCGVAECRFCRQNHNPQKLLKRFFALSDFRVLKNGRPLQEQIISAGLRGESHFGILPTGGGKSLCYQLPALANYERTGELTIVISPLQSLMKDQVDNLTNKSNAQSVAAIYGLLTPPERGAILQQIQLGDIGLLYLSPEQLRNNSVQRAIRQRQIGFWVFDEAHCLSKWGHDFRPDYLYAARFIREFAVSQASIIPPIACFSATAKPDVIQEIVAHFKTELKQTLVVFEGTVERDNLSFNVLSVNFYEKFGFIHDLLTDKESDLKNGSVIIYCATRAITDELSTYLAEQGWRAESFHGGLTPAKKRQVQDSFVAEEIPIICATNAFGMGIDKENVRLVIHFNIPGSLENYIQEAGRAGRDSAPAECILLYDEKDIETQFKLGAMNELRQRDILNLLRALKTSQKKFKNEIIMTSGELLKMIQADAEAGTEHFAGDTMVKTALSWLERSGFIERNSNQTQVFQGRPNISSIAEAQAKFDSLGLDFKTRQVWLSILQKLFNLEKNEGVSVDELSEAMNTDQELEKIPDTRAILNILNQMALNGVIKKGVNFSAYLRPKGPKNARDIFKQICDLEIGLLDVLVEESAKDLTIEWAVLNLRELNQRLLDKGFPDSNPQILRSLLMSLAQDGKGGTSKPGLVIKQSFQATYRVRMLRSWEDILFIARRRRDISKVILEGLYDRLSPENHGQSEVLVEFSLAYLSRRLIKDLSIEIEHGKLMAAIDRGLLFLHEQKVIILQHGLAVFRQAMTIQLRPESKKRRYTKGDYLPLALHYKERTMQVHVIDEYARLALEKLKKALLYVTDYFSMDSKDFTQKFFSDRKKMLEIASSEAAYQKIVDALNNPIQSSIVTKNPKENILILAGPGSGKTTTIIHRCAYLIRIIRANPKSILVLCYNHKASILLRKRLKDIIEDEARHVTILTFHGLAMRLLGLSFNHDSKWVVDTDEMINQKFQNVIDDAIGLLKGEKSILGLEDDYIRDQILYGYEYILVDEYQDIDRSQYQFISEIAGRTIKDPDRKLSILAVGDDDQSIYGFRGANVEFIRRFKKDYHAKEYYLVENYRSTPPIINAANAFIQHNHDRMKTKYPIKPAQVLRNLDSIDSKALLKGKPQSVSEHVKTIQILNPFHQAQTVFNEIKHQKSTNFDWQDTSIAVFSRNGLNHPSLAAMRMVLTNGDIPFSYPLERQVNFPITRIREFHQFLKQIDGMITKTKSIKELMTEFYPEELTNDHCHKNPWHVEIKNILKMWRDHVSDQKVPMAFLKQFFLDTINAQKREYRIGNGVYLSTVHGAKGLEFDHVYILDGGWHVPYDQSRLEEERRLYYVGMTRAKKKLTLLSTKNQPNPFIKLIDVKHLNPQSSRVAPVEEKIIKYYIWGMHDLFIDFGGRFSKGHAVHNAIGNLTAGSLLKIKFTENTIRLFNNEMIPVAQLSNKACHKWKSHISDIISLRVLAMIVRYVEDVKPAYQSQIKNQSWELPLVEVQTTRSVK